MRKLLFIVFVLLSFTASAQDDMVYMIDVSKWIEWGIVAVVIILVLLMSVLFVSEKTVVIIERFGKYHSTRSPGLKLKVPLIDRVAERVSLQVTELEVEVETKTKDNVFVKMEISVQRQVISDKVYKAFYELEDADAQTSSYVFDTIRAEVPQLTLDELFEKKDEIADQVQKSLRDTMDDFGYIIKKTLITDIDPAEEVKAAMNKINASKRLMEATKNEAEAERITAVKKAEAEAESKKLQGEGIANQRKAIAAGLREAAEDLKESLGEGATSKQVMQLLLTTQYYDALRDIAANDKTNTVFLPHSPTGIESLGDSILKSTLLADAAKQ